jgi:hypothetical protein
MREHPIDFCLCSGELHQATIKEYDNSLHLVDQPSQGKKTLLVKSQYPPFEK